MVEGFTPRRDGAQAFDEAVALLRDRIEHRLGLNGRYPSSGLSHDALALIQSERDLLIEQRDEAKAVAMAKVQDKADLWAKLAKTEQERDELRANFTRWSQEKADELEAFRAKLEQTEQERDLAVTHRQVLLDQNLVSEQERDEARIREDLLRNCIRQDEVRYLNLNTKLTKAEAVIEAAWAVSKANRRLERRRAAENGIDLVRLDNALATLDQEEEAHG